MTFFTHGCGGEDPSSVRPGHDTKTKPETETPRSVQDEDREGHQGNSTDAGMANAGVDSDALSHEEILERCGLNPEGLGETSETTISVRVCLGATGSLEQPLEDDGEVEDRDILAVAETGALVCMGDDGGISRAILVRRNATTWDVAGPLLMPPGPITCVVILSNGNGEAVGIGLDRGVVEEDRSYRIRVFDLYAFDGSIEGVNFEVDDAGQPEPPNDVPNDGPPCGGRIPEREVCDGIDNDCNGQIDEGVQNGLRQMWGGATRGV